MLNDGLHGMVKAGENQAQEGFGGNQVGILPKDGAMGCTVRLEGAGFRRASVDQAKPKGKAKAPPVPILIEPLPGEAVIYRISSTEPGLGQSGLGMRRG